MNSRERVLTALAHQEPDRVPIDLGGTVVSTIAIPTYAAVRRHLGLPERPIETLELVQQVARVDEDVMDRLGVDVIPVFANPPDAPAPALATAPDGTVTFLDDFGATLRRPPGCHYFDWREFPLAEPSLEALAEMPWPDPAEPTRYRGLRARVQALRAGTDRALFGMAPCGHDLFNQIFRVRGMENGLMDLVAEPEFAEAFFDRLCDTICTARKLFLTEVGDLIDVHFAADDLAGQSGPLISPELWRRMVKPRQARIIATIKAHTRAPVFYHTCGAATEFLDDLAEIGVDILNPVQVSAAGMGTAQLKKRFGKRLSFWGGGCDTQKVLPYGTPDEVREEVRQRIRELAPGGGFVFNPVHNIQPLVPPANVAAMFDAALEFGMYNRTRSNSK
jgi:uroporphyrinogen decarboxylase